MTFESKQIVDEHLFTTFESKQIVDGHSFATFETEVAYMVTDFLGLFLFTAIDIIQLDVIASHSLNAYESDTCLLNCCYVHNVELYA
jgi:hypothetical protein